MRKLTLLGTLLGMGHFEIEGIDNAVEWSGADKHVCFSSNDILGMAQHPELKSAMKTAVDLYGLGSTGSRRLSGNHQLFRDVEKKIANWVGKPAGVLFNSGYQMNSAIFKVLADSSTLVVADKLMHASIIDGILSSKATLIRYQHNNVAHCRQILSKFASKFDQIYLVCESIYSMDGDESPIHELIQLKHHYGASLVVDEAHSIGIMGKNGNGWANQHQVLDDIDILLVAFGKAMGVCGAMALTNSSMADLITSQCRSYIYSTALPLPVAFAVQASCELIQTCDDLREQIKRHIHGFKSRIKTKSNSHIQPIVFAKKSEAVDAEKALRSQGHFVHAIHYPTVPKNESRLRITLTANHTTSQINALVESLSNLRISN